MAKRFTDSEKWKKPFIKNLPLKYKVLWFYILDDCNHAGIWQVDLDVASIRVGEKFNIKECIKVFGDKIKVFHDGEKWFIKDFIDFQYGELKDNNRAHKSALSLLRKYNLLCEDKPLISPLQGGKDKEQYKDKDISIEEKKKEVLKRFDETNFENTQRVLKTSKEEIRKRLLEFLEVEVLTPTFKNKPIGEVLKHFRNWLNYNKPLEVKQKTKAPWLGND
jgi:hypothetical protein